MSTSQQQLIKQYFNSLVQEFIKDPLHNQYITINFTDCIEKKTSGDTLGETEQTGGGSNTTWDTINGVEVPGSRKTTYKPYQYTVTFLNSYEDDETVRKVVVHEFTHLYLDSIVGEHDHDNNFYSHMEKFEIWMNNKWGLTPRKYKGGDWTQHVDPAKREQQKKQYPTNEFNYLNDLIQQAKSSEELENNWKTVKNSSLYTSSKKTHKKFKDNSDGTIKKNELNNKEWFDREYTNRKSHFQPSNKSNNDNPQPHSSNQTCEKCGEREELKMTSTNLCYQCRREQISSMLNQAQANLEEAKNSYEKFLSLGADSDSIKDSEKVVKKCEKTLKDTELNYLISLVNDVIELTILEANYQKVKEKFLYSNNQTELDSYYQKRKKCLSNNHTERERERERDNFQPSEPTNWIPWIGSILGGVIVIYFLGKIISSFRPTRRRKISRKK